MSADDLPDEVIARFRQLAAERLGRAESIWFSLLQGTTDPAEAAELHRLVHTLKGDARLVRFDDIDLVCHKLEDLLDVAQGLAYAVPDDVDLLVTMSFHFIGLLARKRTGTSVAGIDLDGFVQEVDQVVLAAHALERFPYPSPEGSAATPPEADPSLDQATRLARAATLAFVEHLGASGASQQRLQQLWWMLRHEVAALCSTPLRPLVDRHLRAAHELCAQLGKLVDIDVDTQGLCVAARVADAVDVGLLHCIRNAVDHGLEPPDERGAAGKPRSGAISITAEVEGDAMEVVIEDDGRGLDHQAIARRAVEAGLDTGPSRGLDVHALLFRPGFSTARRTSQVSGRGVGLDAVRSALHTVGGEVSAHDRPGGGTRLVMRVPAPMHHMQVHVFEARPGLRVAIPATWAVTSDPDQSQGQGQGSPWTVDPLEVLGVVERSACPSPHVVRLRWGRLHACYPAWSVPRIATAQRICPTTSTDPTEVVMVSGQEVLVLRPEQLPGSARASVEPRDERAV